MKIRNIHTRLIDRGKAEVVDLFVTLASADDKIWPYHHWPPMRFRDGLKTGSEGGHGPIRYKVIEYRPSGYVKFEFQRPKGFDGVHFLEITETTDEKTLIRHAIEMRTRGLDTITWLLAIRWLHDALIEDAFDKVENHFNQTGRRTAWSPWVRFLRRVLKG